MKEGWITREGSGIRSNYIFCPSLCHGCIHFKKEKRHGVPAGGDEFFYWCHSNSYTKPSSAKIAENGYQKETYKNQFDDCESYKNKVEAQMEEAHEQENRKKETESQRQLEEERAERQRRQKIAEEAKNQRRREDAERQLQKRKKQFEESLNETYAYGEENNLISVNVCLPKKVFLGNKILSFLESYDKIDRLLDASVADMNFRIEIERKGIEKIKESNKMKDYFSDNKKNDMFAFKNKGAYVIISPEIIFNAVEKANENNPILVDRTPYEVWFKEEALTPFVKNYNELVKKLINEYNEKTEREKKERAELEQQKKEAEEEERRRKSKERMLKISFTCITFLFMALLSIPSEQTQVRDLIIPLILLVLASIVAYRLCGTYLGFIRGKFMLMKIILSLLFFIIIWPVFFILVAFLIGVITGNV